MIFLKKWSFLSMIGSVHGRRRPGVEDGLAEPGLVDPLGKEHDQPPAADSVNKCVHLEDDRPCQTCQALGDVSNEQQMDDGDGIRRDPYFYHVPLIILVSFLSIYTNSLPKNPWL
jgi:hypothetical protein